MSELCGILLSIIVYTCLLDFNLEAYILSLGKHIRSWNCLFKALIGQEIFNIELRLYCNSGLNPLRLLVLFFHLQHGIVDVILLDSFWIFSSRGVMILVFALPSSMSC
ncbi:hypothetical protein ACJX0J_020561 [Zea mays]